FEQLYTHTRDSVRAAQKANAILLYQTQYETKEKEVKIDVLGAEKEEETSKRKQFQSLALALGAVVLIAILLLSLLLVARKKLSKQNVELQSLNQTKDRFFGMIAHDLRSPIVALGGVDEQMEFYMNKGDNDKVKKISNLVGSTSRKLNGLLDNLLNWALIQTGNIPHHPEEVDVKKVTEEVLQLYQANIEVKGLEVKMDMNSSNAAIMDENALRTVLRNLVGNAIKFTEKNGVITLKTRPDGQRLKVIVQDSGVGMNREQQARLFQLSTVSQTGTAGEKGSGLGLVMIMDLLKMNNGKIDVDSTVGKGSVFTVDIPRS
ncbi:MAG: HAMP domain-containing sensor histidine kinase, partial [Bacteroidota bacterium]